MHSCLVLTTAQLHLCHGLVRFPNSLLEDWVDKSCICYVFAFLFGLVHRQLVSLSWHHLFCTACSLRLYICTCHCLAFSALLCLVLHLCICISLVVFLYLHYCLVLPTRHWQACHGLTFPAWLYIQLHLYMSFCTYIFVFLFLFGHALYSALFSNRTTLVHLPVLHLAHR